MKQRCDIEQTLSLVSAVVAAGQDFVPLHEPVFSGNEWTYVKDCLDTGWVSSVGKYVDKLEVELADYVGVEKAVAVVNGTAALQVCLLLAGVKPGDEVLLPALTFIATANAVSYVQAVPHFVDSEERTLGLDPNALLEYLNDTAEIRGGEAWNRLTGRRIAAVIPMHTFGHPVDLDPLLEVCAQFGIVMVEDAAESLGSYYKGRHTGQFGRLSAVSFNGNKIITTGGGGAILTNDPELGRLAKHLTTTAKVPHPWAYVHDQIGFNFRMPNINAALGCAQLEELPAFLASKRLLAERYEKIFAAAEGVRFFSEPDFAKSNFWLNTLVFDDASTLDTFLQLSNDQGVMTRPAWTLMSELTMFADCPSMDLAVAKSLARRLVNIPSSANL